MREGVRNLLLWYCFVVCKCGGPLYEHFERRAVAPVHKLTLDADTGSSTPRGPVRFLNRCSVMMGVLTLCVSQAVWVTLRVFGTFGPIFGRDPFFQFFCRFSILEADEADEAIIGIYHACLS